MACRTGLTMGSRAVDLGKGLSTLLSGLETQAEDLRALMSLRGLGVEHVDVLQRLEMQICAVGAFECLVAAHRHE